MKLLTNLIKMNIKVYIQDKWGYLFTLFIQPILMIINYLLYSSIYEYNNTSEIKGYELNQMIWYFTAVNFIFVFIWNTTHTRIAERVLSGDMSIDLLRPVSLFKFEIADAIADRIVGILCEFIPAIFLYSLIVFPKFLTLKSMIMFLIVVMFAFILYFNISYIIGMFAFLIKNNNTIIVVKEALITLLGGVYFPLEFLPDRLNAFLDLLPFKYVFYWPIQFFLNNNVNEMLMLRIIVKQLIWSLILYVLSKFITRIKIKKYCAVGG